MSADPQQQPTCPVDHKSREAWLEKARAASQDSPTAAEFPPFHPSVDKSSNAESCPVDHGAREVWMQQARAAASSNTRHEIQSQTAAPTTTAPSPPSSSSWSSYLPRLPYFSSPPTTSNPPTPQTQPSTSPLGLDREVSTIPRTPSRNDDDASSPSGGDHHHPPPSHSHSPSSSPSHPPSHLPANNEQETGADRATGNWIYPSERMFFDAMKRKGHDPRAADMRTVVPIHNAVNERAWAEIKAWEGPWIQGSSCSGPRLHSFSGLSTQMSPKARLNTLLGYQAPFDRHDWVVDRCGKEIEYVIDFYAGRNASNGADGKLSFYLDVRPKLNSWEGIKMRAFRAAGLS
ncbi:cytochrome c/c1 heme-lyase [Xylaria sp. FL1042]|nr:cytochrome c/c1 heme-lyase [Xylaria sp. FL1042]